MTTPNDPYSVSSQLSIQDDRASDVSVGAIVVAPFEHDESWYRARVMAVDALDGVAHLLYVDFGDTGRVELAKLKRLLWVELHLCFGSCYPAYCCSAGLSMGTFLFRLSGASLMRLYLKVGFLALIPMVSHPGFISQPWRKIGGSFLHSYESQGMRLGFLV